MLPWETIATAKTPDGTPLTLARRGTEWVVRAGGHMLMSSHSHLTEERMALLALERLSEPKTVLLGGLGLGFTLRAVLDRMPQDSRVIVAELSPALIEWNKVHVAELAGKPLEDPRVRLQPGDVFKRICEGKSAYDAILLDVDNGPSALVEGANEVLYGEGGIHACLAALKVGGVLAVWSAGPDEKYLERLQRAGFEAKAKTVTTRPIGGVRHTVFVAVKPVQRQHRHANAKPRDEKPARKKHR